MNGDVFIFIYTSRGIYLFSRSLVERSVFETPSRRNLRGFISAVFMPLVLLRAFYYYCFMFSLWVVGGNRRSRLARRYRTSFFIGSISPILRIEFFVNFLRVVERHRCLKKVSINDK